MDLYDAMSTLRAVRRLRPDPIAEDRAATRFQCSNMGTNWWQHPATAVNRRNRTGKTGAARPVQATLGRLCARL